MRIVLDTNILVRAVASPSGPAGEIFERTTADHVLVLSVELLAELSQVLAYDRVRRLHQLSDARLAEFLESLEMGSTVVPLSEPLPRVVPHDPDDDVVVATAVAGQADVLCSRNRHLFHEDVLAYCREHAIAVMDDVTLLARIGGESMTGSQAP
jgi:putative PIN family toxin of toxin-antitoxin system